MEEITINSVDDLRRLISEVKASVPIFLADVVLETQRDLNLTDILTEIRAVEGVTIVTLIGASAAITAHKERTHLNVKFIPIGNYHRPLNFLKQLKAGVMQTSGVYSFMVKHLEVVREMEV